MDPSDGLPTPRRYWAIATILTAIAMSVLDGAIVNVALPTVARDLGAAPAGTIWVVNAYQIAVVAALLPFASLGEVLGFRRVYQAGLLVFALASLACALSRSLTGLVLARLAQGLGAAAVMSLNAAMVRFTYPHRLLGRAIGINAMVVATAAAAGPTVAAAILSVAPWPWLFAVNVPIAALALAIGARTLPHTEPSRRPFDVAGAVLNVLTFGLLFVGIDTAAEGSPLGVLALAGSLGSAAALVLRQLSQASPLLPLDLLRIPVVALSVAASFCAFAAQMLAFVSLPFLLQGVLGRGQVATGLLMTPWPLAVMITAPVAGRLVDRVSSAVLCGAGAAVLAAGQALLALLPSHATDGAVAGGMAICGLGFGLFQTPNNRTMLAAAPRARSGGAGGMQATARLLGQTLGTTLVALAFRASPHYAPTVSLAAGACFAAVAAVASASRRRIR
jgi:MFS transporter, DHA2 family, multidrug resistance protein